MTEGDDELRDPIVVRALRRIGAHPDRAAVCPRCGHREVAEGSDWCQPCAAEERKASKLDWYHRQGNYRELRIDHGPREAAARWIAHQLRRGALEVTQIRDDAVRAGIAPKTLRRAREKLQASGRLVVEREGLAKGAARWRLTTTAERRPDAQVGKRSPGRRADSAQGEGGLAAPDHDDTDEEPTP